MRIEKAGVPLASRRRRFLLNLLLAGVACVVSFCLAEGALRLAGHRILRDAEFLSIGSVFKLDDPPVGFSLAPHSSRIVAKGGAFLMTERINSQGLRDIEHPPGRLPNTRRILVLGDSFMYGDGVAMEETMPRLLGTLMPETRVINAGVRAYDLGQEYLYYRERVHVFDPDLVLLAFFINDLSPDPSMMRVDGTDGLPIRYERTPAVIARSQRESPRGLRGHLSSFMRSHSMLYVLIRKRLDDAQARQRAGARSGVRNNAADIFYLSAFNAEPPDGSIPEEWLRAYRILDEFNQLTGANGARFAIVVIPAPWQITEDGWRSWVAWLGVGESQLSRLRPQEMIQRWCVTSGTPCLDLQVSMKRHDPSDLYFANDHHWNSQGHRVAAEAVADFLQTHQTP